jgi:hypothetical protein
VIPAVLLVQDHGHDIASDNGALPQGRFVGSATMISGHRTGDQRAERYITASASVDTV